MSTAVPILPVNCFCRHVPSCCCSHLCLLGAKVWQLQTINRRIFWVFERDTTCVPSLTGVSFVYIQWLFAEDVTQTPLYFFSHRPAHLIAQLLEVGHRSSVRMKSLALFPPLSAPSSILCRDNDLTWPLWQFTTKGWRACLGKCAASIRIMFGSITQEIRLISLRIVEVDTVLSTLVFMISSTSLSLLITF